jgi:hypothetical protein
MDTHLMIIRIVLFVCAMNMISLAQDGEWKRAQSEEPEPETIEREPMEGFP